MNGYDLAYTRTEASYLVNLNSAAFWQGWGGSLFLLAVGLAGTITLAFAILNGLCVGSSLIAMLIIGLVVSGAEIAGQNHGSTFVGSSPFSSQVAGGLRSILTPVSGSELDADLGDLSALLGAVTTTWAVNDVESATRPSPGWSAAWGTALGIMALFTASAAEALQSIGAAVVSLFFDVASVIVDLADLLSPLDKEATGPQDVATLVMDVAAGILDGKVVLFPGTW